MNYLPLIAILVVLNAIQIAVYGIDKQEQIQKTRRISEKKLLAFGFVAPVGAIIGMLLFRHKTLKIKFKLVYLFLLLHIIGLLFLLNQHYL